MDLIHLPQDRSKWWSFLNTVIYLRVPKNAANFLIERLLVSQEGFCPMQLVSQVVIYLVSHLFRTFEMPCSSHAS